MKQTSFSFCSFVHFGHGILSYYVFSFLDDENDIGDLVVFRQNAEKVIERASIEETKKRHKRNDKYQQWKDFDLNRSESGIRSVFTGGAGLFATIVSALAFEVFENSKFVIDIFRKNSGKSV